MEDKVQDLASFRVPTGFRGRSQLTCQLWWIVQATLFRLSPQPAYRWRAMLLRAFGAVVGSNTRIRPTARFTYPWKIKIGDNSWIGDRAELYCLVPIIIGDDVCISQDSYLCTGSHDMTKRSFDYDCAEILVQDQVWIATGCFVSPGVTLKKGAVVGARSLVLSDVEEGAVYAGQPARRIRDRHQQ
ncbi:WcaF family extracellular polysaccharide biosynthesis acetyltransferase [Sulfitobacter sp. W002]|uniref:WcaF family extracellular polysaccharide biosynthesis acetyltransferase n=1 Tax=Sulfitobacter sp. W002 TaxID=2867024 RepID=UPI0021A9492B|nr:WcaF family extracellular polysaccharide biosynthesis acetyltransferase [Sulfitobacter sp. W002]UWR30451.1 WcaF family extracellular polysaccharide biosynthesis acetyltransferase [Sulfitobacter sp. W002]